MDIGLEDKRRGTGTLRKLGMRKEVSDAQFTVPDRSVFTRRLRNALPIETSRHACSFSAVLSPLAGQALYEVGRALEDLSEVSQHGVSVE